MASNDGEWEQVATKKAQKPKKVESKPFQKSGYRPKNGQQTKNGGEQAKAAAPASNGVKSAPKQPTSVPIKAPEAAAPGKFSYAAMARKNVPQQAPAAPVPVETKEEIPEVPKPVEEKKEEVEVQEEPVVPEKKIHTVNEIEADMKAEEPEEVKEVPKPVEKEPVVKAGFTLPSKFEVKEGKYAFGGASAPGDLAALVKSFGKELVDEGSILEFNNAKLSLKNLSDDLNDMKQKRDGFEGKVSKLEEDLSNAVMREKSLKAENESLKSEIQNLSQQLDAAQQKARYYDRMEADKSSQQAVDKSPQESSQPPGPPNMPMGYHNMPPPQHMYQGMPPAYYGGYYQPYPQGYSQSPSGRYGNNMYEHPPPNMPMQHHQPQGGDYPDDFGRHSPVMNMRPDSAQRGRMGGMMNMEKMPSQGQSQGSHGHPPGMPQNQPPYNYMYQQPPMNNFGNQQGQGQQPHRGGNQQWGR